MEKTSSILLFLAVLLCIEGLQPCFCRNSTFGCIEREREALLQLRQSFNDSSNRLVSWTGNDCCDWNGVGCNQNTGHVIKLDLRVPTYPETSAWGAWDIVNTSQKLSAMAVDPCLVKLKRLEYLDLSGNYFSFSPIPDFIGSLNHLRYLNLSRAEFGGRIPVQLGNLTRLQILDLSQIYSGSFADDTFQWLSGLSSLKHLDMSYMDLSKALDLMKVLNELPFLLELHLNGCGIQNIHFPHDFMNLTLFSRIQILDLGSNRLTGPIPNAFQNMTAVRSLDLSNNYFNSTIPLWLVNSKSLVDLNLQSNAFENIEDGMLSMLNCACYLKSLDLSDNPFTGEVLGSDTNSSRCLVYDLEFLSLRNSGVNGNLPDYLGQLKGLTELYLSENSLYGQLPSSFGELSMLRGLHLSQNQLNGTIPQSFGRLSTLHVLELSDNQLNGIIPQSLGRLSTLKVLDLSNNQLNGTIPQSLGKLSKLEFLLLSNNQLTGSIPNSLGELVNLWSLDISSNSLKGIVSEHNFVNLINLKRLDIGSNHLTCNIKSDWIPPFSLYHINMSSCLVGAHFPQWLQTQKEAYQLDMSDANISGGFPTWLHNFSALYHLDLSGNQICGSLPTNMVDNFPRLKALHLASNLINGPMSKSLCELDALQLLDLSKNNLSGEIPDCWRERQPLLVINLASNKLSGTIPSSIGHLSRLTWLHLNDNSLQGELPLALRNCTSLQLLDLGENYISGIIPAWIGESLSSLRILRLRKNMFNSGIPLQICGLSGLHILDLALNNLSGGIPRCFGKFSGMTTETNVSRQGKTTLATDMLASAPGPTAVVAPTPSIVEAPSGEIAWSPSVEEETQWHKEKVSVATKGTSLEYTTILRLLDSMDISSNKLNGYIPEELGALTGLRSLNLSHNHLSGKIPSKIGDLKSIESLDLSDNQLSGIIPPSMSTLPSINHLNLSYNNLSGEIPRGNQLQTLDDPSIYAGNLQLCGAPLLNKCPADDDLIEPPVSTDDDREEDKEEKMLFYFVMVVGYATGFWAVIGTLIIKRSWRVTYFHFVDDIKERMLGTMEVNIARLKRRMKWSKIDG